MKQTYEELLIALGNARVNGGNVTYHFADDTKTVSNINKEVFINEKNNRERPLDDVLGILDSIRHDLGAVSLEL
jgi:hypothetical protein